MVKRSEKGLVVYNLDRDRLAYAIGQKLRDNPLSSTSIIRYDGPKDWPQLHFSDEERLAMDLQKSKNLEKKISEYYYHYVHPQIRKLLAQYLPKYYIELHSTEFPTEELFRPEVISDMFADIFIHPANKKLKLILDNYGTYQKKYIDENEIHSTRWKICAGDIGEIPTYYGMTLEIWHRGDRKIPYLADIGVRLVKHLCSHLDTYYQI
jgi:hypothetical protein